MDWGKALWDQHDVMEKHTQSGLELLERYVKFVKERTEIEQNYAKQLRSLSKKYSRRGNKEDQEIKFTYQQAFQEVVNEMNEYASQRELLSENLSINICVELTRYLQELKQERKSYLADVKKAQQNLELNFKHLEACKKRFEKEWKEAEKVNQQVEKTEQDPGSTKADVDKVRMIAHQRTHTADECKNEYAAQLQKYNKMQNSFYHTETPAIFNKLQDMDERRIRKLAEGYSLLADTERKILPSLSKSLDTITAASNKTNEKQDSMTLMEQHKSGVAPPTDVEFEDYSQGIKPATMENSVHRSPKVRIKQLFKKNKMNTTLEKNTPLPVEDYSHLPLDQKKKRLKEKIDDIAKELQKEMDQSEALSKMKGVYEKNSHLGDPASLEPQINQTTHNINRLKVELTRYKTWLNETGDVSMHNNQTSAASISVFPKGQNFSEPEPADNIYECDFDDFDEDVPIGQCQALYNFDGFRKGELSIQLGEQLSILDEDHGDGWVRVRKNSGDEGYVPASYIKIF
ncbi:thyroid hormone receptor interactor 10b [Electrophorus electricus]|uniref:thyroid hormone receptor interactor 10b n=1 Tax=Electrophorus electricus TaxID=8005 RepID=UPI0015CFA8FE|nr:thyroid hormone receptor interactor 10b [Electrophorus electricus]